MKELEDINKQLQDDLVGKEHLAQLGQASSEFVHDLNNPLSVICGYVQILMDKLNDSDSIDGIKTGTAREYLERVEKSVFRCQEMAKMWRSLGQKEDLRMEQCSLAAIRDDRFKYVHFPTLPPLLFDLEEDPNEFRNLAADPAYAATARDYAQRLLTWRMEHAERTLTGMQAGPDGLKTIREPRR